MARMCGVVRGRQGGASLVVVMIMLTVVFSIAVLSARLSLFSERSARNDRDRQVAFESAEAALLDAEVDIMGPNTATGSRVCKFTATSVPADFAVGCGTGANTGLCFSSGQIGEAWRSVKANYSSETGSSSSSNQTAQFGQFTGRSWVNGSSGLAARPPRYTVEWTPATPIVVQSDGSLTAAAVDPSKPQAAYVVTAVGFGVRSETQVMLQTIVYKAVNKVGSGCTS